MNLSYDLFIKDFLRKIREYEFLKMPEGDAEDEIITYMKASLIEFYELGKDIVSTADDINQEFVNVDIEEKDVYEIINIVTDGMIVHWLKPYLNNQENLENLLNTADYSQYSPANLLKEIGNAYNDAEKRFKQKSRDYSFNHNDLTGLHL